MSWAWIGMYGNGYEWNCMDFNTELKYIDDAWNDKIFILK